MFSESACCVKNSACIVFFKVSGRPSPKTQCLIGFFFLGRMFFFLQSLKVVSGHLEPKLTTYRRLCDVIKSRRIDVNTTSFLRHMPAGYCFRLKCICFCKQCRSRLTAPQDQFDEGLHRMIVLRLQTQNSVALSER